MIYGLSALALIIGFIALAKRGRSKRRMGKYIRGTVDESTSAAALAAKDVVSAVMDETVNERTLISSIVAIWSLRSFTPIANSGPLLVGVAHSDYSEAEIEEFLEATASWNEGDKVAQEVAKRLIRRIGTFGAPDSATDSQTLNDGKPIKTKLNWILLQGQTLQVWVYNLGSAAVATTTPVVDVAGHANLWPR